jgi:hypothetical protein
MAAVVALINVCIPIGFLCIGYFVHRIERSRKDTRKARRTQRASAEMLSERGRTGGSGAFKAWDPNAEYLRVRARDEARRWAALRCAGARLGWDGMGCDTMRHDTIGASALCAWIASVTHRAHLRTRRSSAHTSACTPGLPHPVFNLSNPKPTAFPSVPALPRPRCPPPSPQLARVRVDRGINEYTMRFLVNFFAIVTVACCIAGSVVVLGWFAQAVTAPVRARGDEAARARSPLQWRAAVRARTRKAVAHGRRCWRGSQRVPSDSCLPSRPRACLPSRVPSDTRASL